MELAAAAVTAFRALRLALIGRECQRGAVAMMRALTFSTPKVVGVEIGRKAAKQRIAEEAAGGYKEVRLFEGLGD